MLGVTDLEMIDALANAGSDEECDAKLLRHQWASANFTATQLLAACAQNALKATREFARRISALAQIVSDGTEAGGEETAQAVLAEQKDAIAQVKEDMCDELANRLVAIPGTSGPDGQTITEAPTLQTPPAGTVSSASGKSEDLQKFKPTPGLKLLATDVIAEFRAKKSLYRTQDELDKADSASSSSESDEDEAKAKKKRAKKGAGHLLTAEMLLNIPAEMSWHLQFTRCTLA
jgi:hypothetical protein